MVGVEVVAEQVEDGCQDEQHEKPALQRPTQALRALRLDRGETVRQRDRDHAARR
jgi:hypothetical protein